jgi:hypothetical protein
VRLWALRTGRALLPRNIIFLPLLLSMKQTLRAVLLLSSSTARRWSEEVMKLSSGSRCPERQQGAEKQDELPAAPRLGERVAAMQLHSKPCSRLETDPGGSGRQFPWSYAVPLRRSSRRTLEQPMTVSFQILTCQYQWILRILKFHLSNIIEIQFLPHRKHTASPSQNSIC